MSHHELEPTLSAAPSPRETALPRLFAATALVALVMLLTVPSTTWASPVSPSLQVAQVRPVLTTMGNEEVEALLRETGYEPTKVREHVFRIKMGNYSVLLFNQKTDMQLYAGFKDKSDTSAMNEWNKKNRYTRAYLDKDGDPVLESDFDLEGGVTPENVKAFIVNFRTLLPKFAELLGR